jgi:NAD(P)-dependent dehydrogenase (short-subunit alcohol dehydrogenase family)
MTHPRTPRPGLEGRTALVTGASRGIGLAIARRLVADGARVAITARKAEPLAEVAATFPEGTVLAVAGKSDDAAHRREVVESVVARWGRLDVLVNNAGINPVFGPIVDLDLDGARKILEVNVVAAIGWAQEVWRHPGTGMSDRGGSIVQVSSVTGVVPSEGIGMYGISKAATMQLTRTLAVELGPRVRVNAVAPAVVRTEFARALYEGKEAEVTARYPLARLGEPDDIAGAVSFLVSDDASWITGQVLTLDGGLLSAGGAA